MEIKKKDLTPFVNTDRQNFLTIREIEFLSLAALGCKNKDIAKILFVSKSTVKKTFENVFRDLNAKNKANAVAIAFVLGIIDSKSISDTALRFNIDFFN